eukprot:m.89176 g.89176  ORF g.89176 m.89176 type:complete len:64 (+) comp12884_c0_seq2:142-333(+)
MGHVSLSHTKTKVILCLIHPFTLQDTHSSTADTPSVDSCTLLVRVTGFILLKSVVAHTEPACL